jgi:Tol biopolymer transport system component
MPFRETYGSFGPDGGTLTIDEPLQWSADGSRLIAATVIWPSVTVVEVSTREWRQISPTDTFAIFPAVSPDGRTLVYLESPAFANDWSLVETDLEGQQRRSLATDLPDGFAWVAPPSWSPDGATLVVSGMRAPDEHRLFALDVSDGTMRSLGSAILDRRVERLLASWSPDGTWIAINGVGSGELTLMSADGSVVRPLTTSVCGNVRWSPDASSLVYVACTEDGGLQVRSIAIDGSGEVPIGTPVFWSGHEPTTVSWQGIRGD